MLNTVNNYPEYINKNENSDEPKTFSTILNNDDILQMYLKEIGKKRMLTKEEEANLGKLIQEGTQEDKEKAIKHHKVGVAESNKKEIIKALDNLFVEKKNDYSSISYDELYELGLVGRDDSFLKRDKLSKQLNLGFNNAKSLLKKLNILGIDKSKIEEIING